MNTMAIYAHTLPGHLSCDWEPLYGSGSHSERVVRCLESFSSPFSPVQLSEQMLPFVRTLGWVHDMGKASTAFQQYLHDSASEMLQSHVNHKTAGAKWAVDHCGSMGALMAYALYGHHSGLPSGTRLFEEIAGYEYPVGVCEALPPEIESSKIVPPLAANCSGMDEIAYTLMLAVRMMHSCLIDADWLETEAFMSPDESAGRKMIRRESIDTLSKVLEAYLADREKSATGRINDLRREIHEACYIAAEQKPGVFRLNVPTGGGKTLSSLSFALKHALQHGLRRVIYVIPYTSIIEQTAQVFREVLGADNVLEHHSNLELLNDSEANRYAVENWDAPVIVTTSVQFFESLFASQNSRCRKLHNIARSVVIFDEAQCLPCNLLSPCLQVMKALRRLCGCSLVLCTATQPALEYRERFFEIGWPSHEVRSLIGDEMEQRLALEMKRVHVQELGNLTKEQILEHFAAIDSPTALFIVNLTRQASELFEMLSARLGECVYHLSARMCPKHRASVLSCVKERLAKGMPTVLVATRVVEAGVDISFPVVYREACGLDSLAQAAGRCNRHGEEDMGMVFFYSDTDFAVPASMPDLRDGIYAAADVNATMGGDDVFSPSHIQRYFELFYSNRKNGTKHWDKEEIGVAVGQGISMVKAWDFPEIDKRFQMIPSGQRSVLVCYGQASEVVRSRLRTLDELNLMPGRSDYRTFQQYAVNVYEQEWLDLYPHMERVHSKADIWMLVEPEFYSCDTGLLREPVSLSYIC